jgi:predicted deacylase
MDDTRLFRPKTFQGGREGSRLLVTAGVHGDEFASMLAVQRLIHMFSDDTALCQAMRGSVTLVPVVNESAFVRGHRCGEDGLDLARSCPGCPDGSVTERVAFELSELIRQTDYYIDLHTGGTELSVYPLAGYVLHRDREILEKQRAMARAFNLPFVWGTSAELAGRSMSVGRDANVPAIYVEYLGGSDECIEGQTKCVDGCLNIMAYLGFIERQLPASVVGEIIEDSRPESGHMQVCNLSPLTGFFQSAVGLGQNVECGTVLGAVSSLGEHVSQEVRAQQSGRVVVLRRVPRVNKGESIGVIAERGHEA